MSPRKLNGVHVEEQPPPQMQDVLEAWHAAWLVAVEGQLGAEQPLPPEAPASNEQLSAVQPFLPPSAAFMAVLHAVFVSVV